jgi:hypothetical protein
VTPCYVICITQSRDTDNKNRVRNQQSENIVGNIEKICHRTTDLENSIVKFNRKRHRKTNLENSIGNDIGKKHKNSVEKLSEKVGQCQNTIVGNGIEKQDCCKKKLQKQCKKTALEI